MQKFFFFICTFFLTVLIDAQNNYVLIDVTENSDIVNNISVKLDSANKIDLLNSVFKPVLGKYKSYRFIETYFGESPKYLPDSSVIVLLHDILILIVDKENRIIDGYQYSLEYADFPSSCDLYRLYKTRRMKLDSKLELSSLKFKLMKDSEYCGRDSFLYLSQNNLIGIITPN
jgi:hypothetical protein